MEFTLNKTNLHELRSAFRRDKLAKSARKVQQHGLDRFTGTFEARGDALHVMSGRVRLRIKAAVTVPGSFSIRDAVFRQLLATLSDEDRLHVVADAAGLNVNGSSITFGEGDYAFSGRVGEGRGSAGG
jgi:hypothetical protein